MKALQLLRILIPLMWVATVLVAASGCASKVVTQLKKVSNEQFAQQFHLVSEGEWVFSDRTNLVLRAYDLEKQVKNDSVSVLVKLQKEIQSVQNQNMLYGLYYAFSEIAHIEARKWEREKPKFALEIHFAALLHSYQYLFDPKFDQERNPYDPQFRNVCLIYNHSLQRMLRLLGNEYELSLDPGHTYAIQSLDGTCNITCSMLTDDWKREEIEKFKFADDYEIKGLQNEYKQYGLGVPLIAIRKKGATNSPLEKYYPPGLCFPVTAFLRPGLPGDNPTNKDFLASFHDFLNFDENSNGNSDAIDRPRFHAVLELYDSTILTHIQIVGHEVPLESDLTTPLAYFLSDPRLNNLSTIGLLRPDALLISRILPNHADDLKQEEKAANTALQTRNEKQKFLGQIFPNLLDNDEQEQISQTEDHLDDPDINPLKHASFQLKKDERVDLTLVAHLAQRPEKRKDGKKGAKNDERNIVPDSNDPSNSLYGIYMTQPYDPNKIPVVMVHGLWSSPITWMEMFNNIRALPEIRDNYQFWFYFYPSAQPFWISAAQLRADLDEIRNTINREYRSPALDDMILVGHSMGGLISRMQTIDSGENVWKLVSDVPLNEIDEDAKVKEDLRDWFYFSPNPSVSRVITIATPFHGSDYSNNMTQWISNKAIQLPQTIVSVINDVTLRNKQAFGKNSLMKLETSVQSLAPSNPLFPILLSSETPSGVRFNNIIGVQEHTGLEKYLHFKGDGVVAYDSAKIDRVESEIEVPAPHSYVHTHPKSIMEVRRILLENLRENERVGSRYKNNVR